MLSSSSDLALPMEQASTAPVEDPLSERDRGTDPRYRVGPAAFPVPGSCGPGRPPNQGPAAGTFALYVGHGCCRTRTPRFAVSVVRVVGNVVTRCAVPHGRDGAPPRDIVRSKPTFRDASRWRGCGRALGLSYARAATCSSARRRLNERKGDVILSPNRGVRRSGCRLLE